MCFALIGKNDNVVNPILSNIALSELKCRISFGDHGHRTPLEVFNKYIFEISEQLSSIIN